MSRSLVLIMLLGLGFALAACEKKPAQAPAPKAPAEMAAEMAPDRVTPPAGDMAAAQAPPTADATGGAVLAGLSDPDVVKRAVDEASKPQLGAKGFGEGGGAELTTEQACTALVQKMVACKLMHPQAVAGQSQVCLSTAAQNAEFKERVKLLPRFACDHLARVFQPPVQRGATDHDGQGVGVVTDELLQKLGADMIAEAVATYGKDDTLTRTMQEYCNQVTAVFAQAGKGNHPVTCAVVNASAFNATALPGHIVFHAGALHSLWNLAIAQIALAADLPGYQRYQISLASHALTGKPLNTWPVPGCNAGDMACRAQRLQDPRVRARFDGLIYAVLAHEFGHIMNHHARRKILRMEVLRVNMGQYEKLTRGQKAQFMNQLGNSALGQADEYESDEESLRWLHAFWKSTGPQYQQATGDPLMGPQPMDIVYVSLFMQSLSDAVRQLTNKDQAPSLVNTHPASHARADRALRVIIANGYGGAAIAKAAYDKLILRQAPAPAAAGSPPG
jgi:hypothetical protein